jgi:putative Mn2+ efflux pump MntP
MNFTHLYFVSICLAADAFAVSLAKGFTIEEIKFNNVFTTVFTFGASQILMSLLGLKIGKTFTNQANSFSHLIIFSILIFTGSKMIFDAWKEYENKDIVKIELKSNFFVLSLATGIDSLIISSSFSSLLNLNITFFIVSTGLTTSLVSLIGIFLGYRSSSFMSHYTNFIGGCILILIGFKSLF